MIIGRRRRIHAGPESGFRTWGKGWGGHDGELNGQEFMSAVGVLSAKVVLGEGGRGGP